MRLVDLNPRFLGSGGEGISRQSDRPCPVCGGVGEGGFDGCQECHGGGKEYEPAPRREGVGVILTCPCGQCDEYHELYVPFTNPLDGGPPIGGHPTWQRTGETFDTLTLTPSILRNKEKGGCGWHGFITNGDVHA